MYLKFKECIRQMSKIDNIFTSSIFIFPITKRMLKFKHSSIVHGLAILNQSVVILTQ